MAQLASALPWHGRGHRFESDMLHHYIFMKITNLQFGKQKIAIISGTVFAILIVFAAFTWQYSEQKSESYKKALAEWRQNDRERLVDLVTMPDDLFIFADNANITKKILKEQTDACSKTATNMRSIEKHARSMPVLGRNFVAELNPKYKKSVNDSQKRVEKMDKYYDDVSKAFVTMYEDCKWSGQLAGERLDIYPQNISTSKLLIQPGATASGMVCQQQSGCLPTVKKDIDKYIKAYEDSAIKEADVIIATFGEPCAKTTIKSLCQKYEKAWNQHKEKQLAYVDALKSTKNILTDSKIKKALKDLESDKLSQGIFTETVKVFPDLKSKSNINKNTLTPETIFRLKTTAQMIEIEKQTKNISRI